MENKCSKAYFEFYKGPKKRTLIFELYYEGNFLTMPQDIQNVILEYNHKLYLKDDAVESNSQTRHDYISSVPKKNLIIKIFF